MKIGLKSENMQHCMALKFKKEHPQLKESTVRAFWEKYHSSLKAKKVGTAITKKLPSLKRGRPLLLGTIDEKVKNFLFALRQKGGVMNTKALIERSKDEHLKLIDLESCYWAKILFRRMGFVKRASTTSRPEIPYSARKSQGNSITISHIKLRNFKFQNR